MCLCLAPRARDPVFLVASQRDHSSHGGGRAAAGEPFWQVGLSIWPRVVGGERYVQALPHLSRDDSSAWKGGVRMTCCHSTCCPSYYWDQVSGRRSVLFFQMSGFDNICVRGVSRSFTKDVFSFVLTVSASRSIPTG